jgi:hypothetical protein
MIGIIWYRTITCNDGYNDGYNMIIIINQGYRWDYMDNDGYNDGYNDDETIFFRGVEKTSQYKL